MKDTTSRPGPRAGDILVAHPGMPANPFARTLVYLHTYSEEGALGFILNRPMGQTLSGMTGLDVLPDPLQDLSLFFGGPVQSDHFIIVRFSSDPDSHRFECEMNPDPTHFAESPVEGPVQLRAFMGYAGWSAGQLEEELERQDWNWTGPDDALLHDAPGAQLWELLAGGDTRWQLLRDHLPPDAEVN